MNKLRKQVLICDIMVGLAMVFMLLTRFFTIFLTFNISQVTKTSIEKVTKVFEANPVAEWAFKLQGIGTVLFVLGLPAMMFGTYLYFRKKVLDKRADSGILTYYCGLFFMMAFINVVNDAAYYLTRYK